jgi:hypothetical protein
LQLLRKLMAGPALFDHLDDHAKVTEAIAAPRETLARAGGPRLAACAGSA